MKRSQIMWACLMVVAVAGCRERRGGSTTPDAAVALDSSVSNQLDGASDGICTTGEVRCVNTYEREACSLTEQLELGWVPALSCTGGQVCSDGQCVVAADAGTARDAASSGSCDVSPRAYCERGMAALCERVIECQDESGWTLTNFSDSAECVDLIASAVSCASQTGDDRCEANVQTCVAAYGDFSCDDIADWIANPSTANVDLPEGC